MGTTVNQPGPSSLDANIGALQNQLRHHKRAGDTAAEIDTLLAIANAALEAHPRLAMMHFRIAEDVIGGDGVTALTFEALDKHGGKVDLTAEVAAIGGGNASVSVDKDRTVTAKAAMPLAYAVVLNELTYEPKRKRLGLKEVQQYVHVMAAGHGQIASAEIDPDSRVLTVEDEEMGATT